MDFLDLAKKRYTVRKYLPKQVEQEKLDLILEAGRLAPTAVNYQPQRIIVLNTPENLEKIKQFTTFNYDVKLANWQRNAQMKINREIHIFIIHRWLYWFVMIILPAGNVLLMGKKVVKLMPLL